MKNYYYLILLLIFSSEIFSQETEFKFNNQTGMTDFIVTKVENKTASELFKKTIEWIKITYKNPDKVILSTIENEYIRFEGSSDILYSINVLGRTYLPTKYQIEISFKEGRYKFDLISMQNYNSPSQYTSGGWTENGFFNGNLPKESIDMVFKKDGSLKGTWKYLPDVPVYFNTLNKSLFDYVISNNKKDDTDW